MNRQTLTIGAGILVAVVIVGGLLVYFERDQAGEGPAPVTGPGRAEEARGIIADIQERRATTPERPAPDLIEEAPEPRPADADDAGDEAAAAPAATAAAPAPAAGAGPDAELDAAFERAKALQADGALDDAQVLFFFGARQGHGPSAYEYAQMNDPNHHSAETSLLPEPDAFQAFRWYTAALNGGVAEAAGRLDALHEWAREAAAAGDAQAEQLLLQWEQ